MHQTRQFIKPNLQASYLASAGRCALNLPCRIGCGLSARLGADLIRLLLVVRVLGSRGLHAPSIRRAADRLCGWLGSTFLGTLLGQCAETARCNPCHVLKPARET